MAKLSDVVQPTKKASAPYKRPTIAGWLTPLLLGPWVSIYGVVSAYAFMGPEWPYVPRWGVWGTGMLLGTVVGAVYILIASLLDVAFLAVRLSSLPNGARAWLGALVPPLGFMVSYLFIRPWNYWKGGPWAVVIAVFLPPIIAALASRVVFRQKVVQS